MAQGSSTVHTTRVFGALRSYSQVDFTFLTTSLARNNCSGESRDLRRGTWLRSLLGMELGVFEERGRPGTARN